MTFLYKNFDTCYFF